MENLLEVFEIYKRNFPFNIREKEIVLETLGNKNNSIIEQRNKQGNLIAVSVVNNSVVLLLCVDKEYRNRGIASKLLKESESIIINKGYNKINLYLGLKICQEYNIKMVFIDAAKDNPASWKTI